MKSLAERVDDVMKDCLKIQYFDTLETETEAK
jgi:hypothetical protein